MIAAQATRGLATVLSSCHSMAVCIARLVGVSRQTLYRWQEVTRRLTE
jgi:hypothetical protein